MVKTNSCGEYEVYYRNKYNKRNMFPKNLSESNNSNVIYVETIRL